MADHAVPMPSSLADQEHAVTAPEGDQEVGPLTPEEQALVLAFESCLLSLTANPPSEIGGSRATDRFDYQKNWTLFLMLELHQGNEDYIIICDYFDDAVALLKNGDADPRMRFYQVKGSKRHWTPSALTAQEKGANDAKLPSVLGKLLAHYNRAHKNIESVNFVSNQYVSVELSQEPTSVERENFSFSEIKDDERLKIEKKLLAELGGTEDALRQAALVFIRTPLSLDGHDTHTRGYLEEFLRRHLKEDSCPVYSIHLVIADEILSRIKDQGKYRDISGLASKKGISRQQFDELLKTLVRVNKANDPQVILSAVTRNLLASGVKHGEKKMIERDLMRFVAERAQPERSDLNAISQTAREFLTWLAEGAGYSTMDYSEILDAGCRFIREQQPTLSITHTDSYLKAIVSWEEHIHEPIPSTDPKSSKGQT